MMANLDDVLTRALGVKGLELWGYEMTSQNGEPLLRVFIEHAGGVELEHCEQASYQIRDLLAAEAPAVGEMALEVSSPGLNRLLFKMEQYQAYVGQEVKLKLRQPVSGRRQLKGILTAAEADVLTVLVDGESYAIPVAAILQGRLVAELKF